MAFGDGKFDPPKPETQRPGEKHTNATSADANAAFEEIFGARYQNRERKATVQDLGRIEAMKLPSGWQSGADSTVGAGYAKEFHPQGRPDIQMVFSYRGSRLGDDATKSFRELIAATPKDPCGQTVDVRSLQRPPLNELMGDEGNKNNFQIVAARTQLINGEPALVVEGKYANHNVNARFIYIDAERTGEKHGGAPVQQISIIAPTKEFYRSSIAASNSLDKIIWKR